MVDALNDGQDLHRGRFVGASMAEVGVDCGFVVAPTRQDRLLELEQVRPSPLCGGRALAQEGFLLRCQHRPEPGLVRDNEVRHAREDRAPLASGRVRGCEIS